MAEVNLRIGTDYESGETAYIRATGSRAVFICGKRGSGKSYTLGVIVEELFSQERGKSGIAHRGSNGNLSHHGTSQ